MFNDGAHRDMVNIFGTIPVPYKVRTSMNNEHSLQLKFFDIQGQSYNIPVSVWILDSHPYHAPVCFVKPTADMQIKVRLCYLCYYIHFNLKMFTLNIFSRFPSMLTKVDKFTFHICMNGLIQNLISLVG